MTVKGGLWNRITEEDRQASQEALLESARKAMEKHDGFNAEAKQLLELQTASVIIQNGGTIGYVNGETFKEPTD